MKLRRDFFDLPDADLRRQQRIDAPQDRVGVHRTQRFDIRHLTVGMNARIGSSRSGDLHFMIKQLSEGLLESSLHRRKAWLYLPSVKLRAVIGEGQFEISHLPAG